MATYWKAAAADLSVPSRGSGQVRQQIEEQVAQKSTELEQYLLRVQQLEDMYRRLEEALEDERRARQDEETVRRLQARWVQHNQEVGGGALPSLSPSLPLHLPSSLLTGPVSDP